jgi:peptide/nickel transport system substrate-binding protein
MTMKRRSFWWILSSLIALSLLLASCGGGEEEETVTEEPVTEEPVTEEPVTEEPVTPPEGGNWWDKWGKPQYGGTINLRSTSTPSRWDPYYFGASWLAHETLWHCNYTTDPEIYHIWGPYVPPEYYTGVLAEDWEQPDSLTLIVQIRKGIYWQDIPPLNGREFTAEDIEFHYARLLGLGYGYTEQSPRAPLSTLALIESVTATDKYTVVFKWTEASIDNLLGIQQPNEVNAIVAREAVELWGDVNDWTRVIGTGPYILKDVVDASSTTYVKNPNYWGFDLRYPENKLPYADKIVQLVIPDKSTATAALRTGKVALVTGYTWEERDNLKKTNPELLFDTQLGFGMALSTRCDREPFTDIRVRTAMQMAIDIPTIAATYYGGNVDPVPYGYIGPDNHGNYIPFDEWPKELKDEYTYNPEGAKKLLAEAGYPNGFKTNCVTSSTSDTDLLQILKAYLLDIGVDMEIKVMEATVYRSYTLTGKHDQCTWSFHGTAVPGAASKALERGLSTFPYNTTYNNDAYYDELVAKHNQSLDMEERKRLANEADMYALEQHWQVKITNSFSYTLFQPWLKGYWWYFWGRSLYAHCWIDQDLKKSMGN